MQSDRRHELETNDLADSATALVARFQPYLLPVGLAAAALLIGMLVWTLVDSRRVAEREEGWDACLAAMGTGQVSALEAVAARYQGTPVAQWSRLVTADGLLDQGARLVSSDRAQAEQRLQAAAATYAGLIAGTPLEFVAERATFGLARARENLGSLEEARSGYEAVVREYPASAVRPLAEARIAALGRESTRQWYDWFFQQKPAPTQAEAEADAASREPTAPAGAPESAVPAAAGTGTDAPR